MNNGMNNGIPGTMPAHKLFNVLVANMLGFNARVVYSPLYSLPKR
jgi:hypothetical protein